MIRQPEDITEKPLRIARESLADLTKNIAPPITELEHIARMMAKEFAPKSILDQRTAGPVATIWGSRIFIRTLGTGLVIWVGLNSHIFVPYANSFGSYSYILLDLALSLVAGVWTPNILMWPIWQSEKDRLDAEHNHEISLKAEHEITFLHDRVDFLREGLWRS
ncbi:MAG: DUF1003 domain-containing protein [Thiobacillaceae bacterium]